MVAENTKRLQVLTKQRVITSVVLLALAGAGAYGFLYAGAKDKSHSEVSSQSRRNAQNFTPTPSEWATLTIEPADTVQAQNDFITAITSQNKAKSALELADIQFKRAKDLYEGHAVPQK